MNPRFTVSVVCYTNLRGAKACIASLLKSTQPFYLMLTANGNMEITRYFNSIAGEFPNIWVTHYGENQGFINPNQHQFDLCATPFFVMLNDDAIVPPDWLEKLVAPFDHDVDMAIVGQERACWSLRDNFYGCQGPRYEYVEFSCAMVRTSILKEHGLFSDYIEFANCEDSDCSLRMRELGYHIAKADFAIQHEVGATRRNVPGLAEIFQRNLAACQHRWADYLKSKDRKFPCER